MTQIFRVELDGADVTDSAGDCDISLEMNRFYNTASFVYESDNTENFLFKDVEIFYGNETFNGFVYSVENESEYTVKIGCRTNGAKLTEPFSPSTSKIENATTALELCALYQSQTGVTISYLSEDFDFGGSYQRDGTILDALMEIANVTGSEFYDDGTGVVIQPNKAIGVEDATLDGNDYFNYVDYGFSITSKGVGFIAIQNYNLTDRDETPDENNNSDLTYNSLKLNVDEATGEFEVFAIPKDVIDSIESGSVEETLVNIEAVDKQILIDQKSLTTSGAIKSISSITKNGVLVSNYSYNDGLDKIHFSEEQTGSMVVNYVAYVQKGNVITETTPMGEFYNVTIKYEDQVVRDQGFILNKSTEQTSGDMKIIIEGGLNPVKGFDVYTTGGNPLTKIYVNDEQYPVNLFPETGVSYHRNESLYLEPVGDGTYKAKASLPVETFRGATNFGKEIPYTTSGEYFVFDKYYPDVKGTYTALADKVSVSIPEINEASAYMTIENQDTGEVKTYDLTMINYNNPSELLCKLNQDVKIDLVSETEVELSKVASKTLSVLKPDGTTVQLTVGVDGFIKIYVTMNGIYKIDTKPITTRDSYTTLTVTVP